MNRPAFALVLAAMTAFSADFPAPETLPASSTLPDPLLMRDGTRITTATAWRTKRAPELRALFQHYMYGAQLPAPAMTAELLREDRAALGGKATLSEVLVSCGFETPVHLLVVIPNQREKAAACFLGLNFAGNYALLDDPKIQMPRGWVSEKYAGSVPHRASETLRGSQKDTWAIEQSIDRGYAVATFFNSDVIPDEKSLAEVALEKLRSPGSDTATIMAWAGAFSRMVDYLVTVPEIDPRRIAVVGHSRNGKAALLAAAFDERIALVIPSQAGCGGSAPSRVAPELAAIQANGRSIAETVERINTSFPHWFAGNFKAFNRVTDKLPFDQHCLIALCAPRPVLLSCATEDEWANPAGQFEMLRAADPVYRLICNDGLGAEEMPDVGRLLPSRLGYYIRAGKHSMTREDWEVWLDYAGRWLKGS